MKMCEEMIKLRKLLSEKEIEWHDESIIYPEERIEELCADTGLERQYLDVTIYRTHFSVGDTHWSAINGYGTYGGFEPLDNRNKGLLELMNLDSNDDIKGWLTAEDVIRECGI